MHGTLDRRVADTAAWVYYIEHTVNRAYACMLQSTVLQLELQYTKSCSLLLYVGIRNDVRKKISRNSEGILTVPKGRMKINHSSTAYTVRQTIR
jgi:hypothetical protein